MTNKAKHTPGPWAVVVPDGGGWCVRSARRTTDARNGGFVSAACPGPDGEANARLIAAAPDLLAALAEVNRGDQFSDATICLERAGHPELAKALRKYRDNALAAIAKARGEG